MSSDKDKNAKGDAVIKAGEISSSAPTPTTKETNNTAGAAAAAELDKETTQMTCEVLCGLSSSMVPAQSFEKDSTYSFEETTAEGKKRTSGKACPKQLQ